MTCDRCGEPILLVERYETIDMIRPTSAGVTVTVHAVLCKRVPAPTRQSGLGAISH